tara:strand:- start:28738 stop:29211 length:474 start_codon:yes stop_codon:yes gene_type:complete
MNKADDAVKRVDDFFAGFIPNEKIFNHGPLPGDRSSLNVEDIRTILAELERISSVADRLNLEAQSHAMEADTANGTIAEIYQIVSGGKGEPGNWNGAKPVRDFVEAQAAEIERLRGLVDSFPDPAFYEVDEFPKKFEKWLQDSMGSRNAEQALKGGA